MPPDPETALLVFSLVREASALPEVQQTLVAADGERYGIERHPEAGVALRLLEENAGGGSARRIVQYSAAPEPASPATLPRLPGFDTIVSTVGADTTVVWTRRADASSAGGMLSGEWEELTSDPRVVALNERLKPLVERLQAGDDTVKEEFQGIVRDFRKEAPELADRLGALWSTAFAATEDRGHYTAAFGYLQEQCRDKGWSVELGTLSEDGSMQTARLTGNDASGFVCLAAIGPLNLLMLGVSGIDVAL